MARRSEPELHARLEWVAHTGDQFVSFGPYVPAVSYQGEIAFQARMTDGSTAIVVVEGREQRLVRMEPSEGEFASHPVLDGTYVAAYCQLPDGRTALTIHHPSGVKMLHPDRYGLDDFGPLGPTVARPQVAAPRFGIRAMRNGRAVVGVVSGTTLKLWDAPGAVEGLPLVCRDTLLVRGELDGQPVLMRSEGSALAPLDLEVLDIGRFPAHGEATGAVVFVGVAPKKKSWAVYQWSPNQGLRCEWDAVGFVSLRGVLAAGAGALVVYGTEPDRELGIYVAAGRSVIPVLGIGDRVEGREVAEFALNPVSIGPDGVFAFRVKFADGEEAIARIAIEFDALGRPRRT